MQASTRILILSGSVVLIPLTLTGCGGYSSPTDPGTPPGQEGAIVTVTSSGVEPKTVTIASSGSEEVT
jgi:hypothetical protein